MYQQSKKGKKTVWHQALLLSLALGATASVNAADPGISDKEVVWGSTLPLSGPNAGYGTIGKAQRACFDYLNAEFGGVKFGDGKTRKVKFVMYDDSMEPARHLQNSRRMVSKDEVFGMSGSPGTGANLASRPYYNSENVPQVFLYTGGPMFGAKPDVEKFPMTMLGILAYNTEAALYAKYIKDNFPNAKVALLNDDSGGPFFSKAFVQAAKDLGVNIVIHEEHSYSEPTIDAKIDRLAASGADVFVDATTPKYVIQAIKRMNAVNWKPKHVVWGVGASIGGTLIPAGPDISKGVITSLWLKDQANPGFANDADMKLYVEKLKKYDSSLNPADQFNAVGWFFCHAVKNGFENAKQPTRKAFMEAMRNMNQVKVPLLLDGVTLTTKGAQDGYPIESVQMGQFDGEKFVPIGSVINYEGKTPQPQ
ncbi:ABC transporter substrate-binding protein [Orrella sp. NBD-18]|uniref:ABC transporter substrate-binding protein n=1 Tax=Sheuella amnicola TaxID=2707330 RepID=A0A6B2QY87_9BURK|nr:ABC transporter substrate-binding protein [Sheuella amnicola]NDY82942.1 ABC transporter substrate-binding protein [Sheuella amnicola]